MPRLTKKERAQVLRAVDCGWYMDVDIFRDYVSRLPSYLKDLAWDCLTVLEDEPWRNFGDVLNEVLDY
jgi:hypothetical protein